MACLGLVVLAASGVAAALLGERQKRRGRKMPPARFWWIAPSAITGILIAIAVVFALKDLEVALFWVLLWPVFLPLCWGVALAARLLWHLRRPSGALRIEKASTSATRR